MIHCVFRFSDDPMVGCPNPAFLADRSSDGASAKKHAQPAIPYFFTGTVQISFTIYIIFIKNNKEKARFYAGFQAIVVCSVTSKNPEHGARNTTEPRILSFVVVLAEFPLPEQPTLYGVTHD
jgi:hypothetical protein